MFLIREYVNLLPMDICQFSESELCDEIKYYTSVLSVDLRGSFSVGKEVFTGENKSMC